MGAHFKDDALFAVIRANFVPVPDHRDNQCQDSHGLHPDEGVVMFWLKDRPWFELEEPGAGQPGCLPIVYDAS